MYLIPSSFILKKSINNPADTRDLIIIRDALSLADNHYAEYVLYQ